MSTIVASGRPEWQAAGPPAVRMAGRAQARAARMKGGNFTPKKKEGISAATVARANAFLSREAVLDDAINQGVISAGMRSHFARLMEADPEGTRAYLEKVGLSRSAGTQQAAADDYPTSGLSDAERRRITAARGGQPSMRIVNGGL
jgi:hypothetical protein